MTKEFYKTYGINKINLCVDGPREGRYFEYP